MNERRKQILTLVITWVGIVAPYVLASGLVGPSTGEISGRFFRDVYVIPADYAFAIWGPIYLGFLAFAVFQALPDQRHNPRFVRVRPWLMASSLLNAVWLVVFGTLNFSPSLAAIIGMLVTALVMHRALEIGKTRVYGLERLFRAPLSLYAGWLTVATVVNAAGVLAVNGWDGFGLGYPVWGVVMLITASAIGLVTRFRWNDPVYGAVFVWALVGVSVKRADVPLVAGTALLLALFFVLTPPTVRGALSPGSAEV